MSLLSAVDRLSSDIPVPPPGPAEAIEAPSLGWYGPIKMAFDFAAASLMLVVAGPLILLLMALVKATSRGPALYKQARVGRDGRVYQIYKIRTMVHDCERLTGPQWATVGDPRVTPLGRFLRASHLDELPQLWNVLRGEMSLVGPRPERPEFVSQLEKAIPGYRERLRVRPGITGLAQVQLPPDVDLASVRRKVRYDACYIRRMGPWLDLRILMGTSLKELGVPFEITALVLNLPGREPAEMPCEPHPEEEQYAQLRTT